VESINMKTILILLLTATMGVCQTNFTAVMVDSNGVVRRPANFTSANNLQGNNRADVNTVNKIVIDPAQWTSMTNTGTMLVSHGRIVASSFSTNAGNIGTAYYGDNVDGHAFLNLDAGAGIRIDAGSGFIVQGSLGGARQGAIKRFVMRGVSASSKYEDVGTAGLDRAGWSVETRLNGTTNQMRLVVHASSGAVASAWTDVTVNSDIKAIFSYRDATNTYAYAVSDFGQDFPANPTVTVTNVAGGTSSPSSLGFGVSMKILTNTSSAPYSDVSAIYEARNVN
jgi:hypothetical protein